MRICHVINIGHEAGGAERSVRLVTDGLRARGHTVNVIATDHRLGEAPAFADTIVPAVSGGTLARLGGFFWSPAVYRGVRQAMARIRPDVVHLHTIGLFSPSVLDATRGCRRVMTVHGPEDWTLRLLSWNLPGRPAEGGARTTAGRARLAYLRFLQRPAYLPRLRRLDEVLVPSAYYARQIECDVGGVPLRVVPNGIVLTPAAPLRNPHVFTFVGRFERTKGVHVLAEAFAMIADGHPRAELVMVGDGPFRPEVAATVERHGLAHRVHLPGWLDHDELERAYAHAGVVVIPSTFPENLPTVAIEALAAGRPLIGSARGGLPELARHGENGLLVPPGDPHALAAAMRRMLDDEELVRRMGAASAQRAAEYSIDRLVDRLEERYRAVLDPVGAAP